ncbi:hypothetical protein O3P69_010446 [Scylla paramamosain]|uniref:Uncharacterized protein n=1 Tax=Scylla paramamosain TaxID=85552 RepID=A0AAW0TSJ4_SCYPA
MEWVLEGIISRRLTVHLDSQHLISGREFQEGTLGRGPQLASDQRLELFWGWTSPSTASGTLLERLRAAGADGALLELLRDYLQERHMVHNGQHSSPKHITASVPQDSVLGLLLCNVYINDPLSFVHSALCSNFLASNMCPDDLSLAACAYVTSPPHRLDIGWRGRWLVAAVTSPSHWVLTLRLAGLPAPPLVCSPAPDGGALELLQGSRDDKTHNWLLCPCLASVSALTFRYAHKLGNPFQ